MVSNKKSEFEIMTDMLIVLLVMSAVAVYYYGLRALAMLVVTVLVCCITDIVCLKLRKKKIDIKDLSSLITGLTLGLMMSASVPYYAAVTAALFATVAVKHAFGGRGCEIFNGAAAGFLFSALCFPDGMLTYPKVFTELPFSSVVSADMLSQSMTKTFLLTGTSSVSLIDVLTGKFLGPMGTGVVILLVVAAVFLMFRRSVSAITFFTELAAIGIYALIYYDFDLMSVLYFFSSGMLLFGMIFLSCDYSVIPKTRSSRFIYGLVTAVCVIIFHFYSGTENAVIYAVIIASPIGIELDRRALSFADMLKGKRRIFKRASKPLKNINETLEILEKNEQE